jgi:toxin secretion/phage lysis holin
MHIERLKLAALEAADGFFSVKTLIAAIGGWFASLFMNVDWHLFAFTFGAIILDYTTGLLAGRRNEGLSSWRATKGLYKKMGLLSLLALGFFLDGAINHFVFRGFRFDIPFDLPIALVVTVWIVITEAISIIENIEKLGVTIPRFLTKLLRGTKRKIDKEEEGRP